MLLVFLELSSFSPALISWVDGADVPMGLQFHTHLLLRDMCQIQEDRLSWVNDILQPDKGVGQDAFVSTELVSIPKCAG